MTIFAETRLTSHNQLLRSGSSVALQDLQPILPGHAVVVPVEKVTRLYELTDDAMLDLWRVTKLASEELRRQHGSTASNWAVFDGWLAGQPVPHAHVHVVPRKPKDLENNDEVYSALEHWTPSPTKDAETPPAIEWPADETRKKRTSIAAMLDFYRAVRQVVSRDVDADNDSVAAVADGAPNALVAVPVASEATANAKAKANKGCGSRPLTISEPCLGLSRDFPTSLSAYLDTMSLPHTWGDELTLAAMAHLMLRPIEACILSDEMALEAQGYRRAMAEHGSFPEEQAFASHRIPQSHLFYASESGLTVALVNLKPLVPGHVLVVPRRSVPRISDLSEEEFDDLFRSVRLVQAALEKAHGTEASRLGLQDGVDAGQSVPHVHVHILPIPSRKGAL
eukprot:symbB.v1.2.010824.t2/scaffold711.1/size292957/5